MHKSNPVVYLEIATKEKMLGKIFIELFMHKVPKTSTNFKKLCENKSKPNYLGCNLHRIIPGFVIQGGDFENGNGTGGYSIYGKVFEDESFNIKHTKRGLLSMANSGANSNGSQFFITLDVLPHLDNKHVVFGQVLKGLEIVDEIETFGTHEGTPKIVIKIVGCGII